MSASRSKHPRRPSDRSEQAHRRDQIHRALASGSIAEAAGLASAALAAGDVDPMMLNLAAWQREEAGDYAAAHALLTRALALAPGDVLIRAAIGAVLRKEGRLDEALAMLTAVLAAEPRHPSAWLEHGYVLDAMGESASARASYRRALEVDPRLAPALGKLADTAARAGDTAEAADLARRALAIDVSEIAANFALATIAIEARDGVVAETRMRALLTPMLAGDDRTRALTLLGDALDRQDRTADAFAAWEQAQANFHHIYASILAPTRERPSHRHFVEHIADQLRSAPSPIVATPVDPVPGEAATHVFLLGYPRSGTTLIENILASAPNVVALEERDTFADSDGVLLHNDGTMPDLASVDPTLVTTLRAGYWRRVREMAGSVDGKVFVDMNPLAGAKLPIIARLFPDARILVMRRDPRDVVLSCFRINFTPSTAAWTFSDLEETARHYGALMKLIELGRERLPLAFHDVRYDRLVSDFAPTVRDMAHFIGLDWTDAFLAFDATARRRGVRTASATQVRRGLYDGRGQWRRYADQLAPVLPILAPWIERLGFDRATA